MSSGSKGRNSVLWPGAVFALCSASLFGASTPFAKLLLGTVDPWLLAALLYLGSGVGLGITFLIRKLRGFDAASDQRLDRAGWLSLAGAIFSGGVVGPVLLMIGLSRTSASTASLLLNLEGVMTALLAWFLFKENFDRRIAVGMVAIVGGAATLSWQGSLSFEQILGPLMIAGACFAWGIDNNLTRKVSLSDPVHISMLKGLAAGAINLLLAALQGALTPDAVSIASAGLVGFFGYGLSLVLFVLALRHLGTARTGAYYSTAPFVGAILSIGVLGDPITFRFLIATMLMGGGVWLHLTERHQHEHEHEPMRHTHKHRHDEHHVHEHEADDPPGEPHSHAHTHVGLRHSHHHFPDTHHRHRHGT